LVRAVSVDFGTNEEEQARIITRQQAREQEMLEREFAILNRSVQRQAESDVLQLTTALDVEKVKTATEAELRRLILGHELDFIDARESGVRAQQLKALEHELQLNRTQRLDGLKAQLEQEQHAITMARTGGERRDVEMDLAVREARHRVTVTRITAEMRSVEREIEDADTRQQIQLGALARDEQMKTMRELSRAELEAEGGRVDLRNKAEDAAHARLMAERHLAAQAELDKMRVAKDLTEAQMLAVSAGFSPAVANVLVERARASADADKAALMREMVQQAKDAQVSSEAQARHFFETGMTGTVGVAQGVGMAAAGAGMHMHAGEVNAGLGTVECPGCHNVIPESDRFCRKCGRPMRQ
ncbi:MAG: hypothetical protein IT181_11490, partial [Acidobacteria bacterium]|nr:hypothetical protein [Acidobacteriota bacterium]